METKLLPHLSQVRYFFARKFQNISTVRSSKLIPCYNSICTINRKANITSKSLRLGKHICILTCCWTRNRTLWPSFSKLPGLINGRSCDTTYCWPLNWIHHVRYCCWRNNWNVSDLSIVIKRFTNNKPYIRTSASNTWIGHQKGRCNCNRHRIYLNVIIQDRQLCIPITGPYGLWSCIWIQWSDIKKCCTCIWRLCHSKNWNLNLNLLKPIVRITTLSLRRPFAIFWHII